MIGKARSLTLILLASCGGTFGGAPTPVGRMTIALTSPNPVKVYLVPIDEWNRNGQRRLLSDDDALSKFESGTTDIADVPVREGRYMLVTECDGNSGRKRAVRALDVSFDGTKSIRVNCP